MFQALLVGVEGPADVRVPEAAKPSEDALPLVVRRVGGLWLVAVLVVDAVVGDPLEEGRLHGHRAEDGQRNLTTPLVSNDRWTSSRWKPTVIPKAVRPYIPIRRPGSTQLKPRPHRKTTAATRPRKGTMMAARVTRRPPLEARPGASSPGA